MTPRHIHRFGSRALLVDLPDLETVMAWHAELIANPLPGQIDCVGAASTVLITFDSNANALGSVSPLSQFEAAARNSEESSEVTIDVVYDGADLASCADDLGLTADSLIQWHTSTPWLAAFGGFAPGFTYCVPEDESQARRIPRRESPRVAVPERAVGLADTFSAVYPRTSPGGWQLIGTSNDLLWDSHRDSPALIVPGDTVHYRAVRERVEVSHPQESVPTGASFPVLRVDDPGLQTVVEDNGRPSYGNLGVTGSGAADRAAAYVANTAVGNESDAAVAEIIGSFSATALVDCVVSVTGSAEECTVDGRALPLATPLLLTASSQLVITPDPRGLRSYLAVRGGVHADEVLGSKSFDALSALGPAPLTSGTTIRTTNDVNTVGIASSNPLRVHSGPVTLRCIAGPRDDWFKDHASALAKREWTVTAQSNRVGLRLDGPPLERRREGELASEGMVAGAVQVPPNGQPVVFLRDHAVTGGYPVIASVIEEDLDLAGQLPPGSHVRFHIVAPDTFTR